MWWSTGGRTGSRGETAFDGASGSGVAGLIESPLALATTIAAATGLAFWLDYRFPAVGKVGASMVAIIFGATLSNTGMVPISSPIYDAVGISDPSAATTA